MRNLHELDRWRLRDERVLARYGNYGDGICGVFKLISPTTRRLCLHVVASSDAGWDHVSVPHPKRVPDWAEMEHVKRAFFRDDETAMQLHVPPARHINVHPNCLHLWRPIDQDIPLPPADFV